MLREEPPEVVASFTTTVGQKMSMDDFSGGAGGSTNVASITINLLKKADGREETSVEFSERLRNNLKEIQFP